MSIVDSVLVLIYKDPNIKGDPPATTYISTLGSTSAGTCLLNTKSLQFIAFVNPTISIIREGQLFAFKKYLFNPIITLQGGRAEEKRREEGAFIVVDLIQGRPTYLLTTFRYLVYRKAISPTNIENSSYYKYSLPIFKISIGNISIVAIESIAEQIARYSKDFIYIQVAIQKILQQIWLVTYPIIGRKSKVPPNKYKLEVPPLANQLQVAYLYKTQHQINQLAFYLHPFRFIKQFLKSPLIENRQPLSPDQNLEEVIILLAPLIYSSLGLVLPSIFYSSIIPDLIYIEPR